MMMKTDIIKTRDNRVTPVGFKICKNTYTQIHRIRHRRTHSNINIYFPLVPICGRVKCKSHIFIHFSYFSPLTQTQKAMK